MSSRDLQQPSSSSSKKEGHWKDNSAFATLTGLIKRGRINERGDLEGRSSSPPPASPFDPFRAALFPAETGPSAGGDGLVTITSKAEVEPYWPPPLNAGRGRQGELSKSTEISGHPSGSSHIRRGSDTADIVNEQKGGAIFANKTEPMPIMPSVTSDTSDGAVKIQRNFIPTNSFLERAYPDSSRSIAVSMDSAPSSNNAFDYPSQPSNSPKIRKDKVGVSSRSAGSGAPPLAVPTVRSASSDDSVKIRRAQLPHNAFGSQNHFEQPATDSSRSLTPSMASAPSSINAFDIKNQPRTSADSRGGESESEKVEVPDEAGGASLGQTTSSTSASGRTIPPLPKLDRLPIPRERATDSPPPPPPEGPVSEDEVFAPWLQPGHKLVKCPKIRDVDPSKGGLREGHSASREGHSSGGEAEKISPHSRRQRESTHHSEEQPDPFLASAASLDSEICQSVTGARGGHQRVPRLVGLKGSDSSAAEDLPTKSHVNIASNLWGRLGKAVFVKGGAAKLAHSPLVAGPLYGREVTSNANRYSAPEVADIVKAIRPAPPSGQNVTPSNVPILASRSSQQSASDDCDKQHPILSTVDAQELMEQLNATGERLVLQPSSYVRPLGSNTTISSNRSASGHSLESSSIELPKNVGATGSGAPMSTQLVVVGAGAGGLATAIAASEMGLEVTVVEEGLMGGDKLNYSCVPSKAVLQCTHASEQVKRASELGVRGISKSTVKPSFTAAMDRALKMRDTFSNSCSVQMLTDMGIKHIEGRACFSGPDSLTVDGKRLKFAHAVIATGASPAIPNIPGLTKIPFLNTFSCWTLDKAPSRLAIIGAGHAAIEIGQAFARFGSVVTIFARSRLLVKEDPDAAKVIKEQLLKVDGAQVYTNCTITQISHTKHRGYAVTFQLGSSNVPPSEQRFDALLVAAGKLPNVNGLGLEAAGIRFHSQHGIMVEDDLATTSRNIYAVGDVCTAYRFTHAAETMAKMVVNQITSPTAKVQKMSNLIIPWVIFCDPQIAHVGLYEADLTAQGMPFQTVKVDFKDVDGAVLQGDTRGFVKIHTAGESDTILGATIVGSEAGGMICQVATTMQAGLGLAHLAAVIHPYPLKAEALRLCGEKYFAGQKKLIGQNPFHFR